MLMLCHIPKDRKEKDNFYKQFQWLTALGNFNTLPQPNFESTQERFLNKLHHGGLLGISYRQCILKENNSYSNVNIYFFRDEAFAVAYKIKGVKYDISSPIVYKIGCEHKFRELSMKECNEKGIPHFGHCYHVYYCDICGMHKSYDTSD